MNSGPTSERVYDAIRRRILIGAFLPGERLDPALLAKELSSSITPIRDALHILAGTGLIVTGTSEGFHVPHIDEPALKDLYGWNLDVLSLAIRSWPNEGSRADDCESAGGSRSLDPADATATLALGIAHRSRNAEHLREVRLLNDRLHPLRLAEARVIAPAEDEATSLAAAFADRDGHRLRRLLQAYHRQRQRKAADIVRARYRR